MAVMENGISVLYGIYVLREQAHAYMDVISSKKAFISSALGLENYRLLTDRNTSRLMAIDDFFLYTVRASQLGPFDFSPLPENWSNTKTLADPSLVPPAEIILLSFERIVVEWCTFMLSSPEIDLFRSKFFLDIAKRSQMEISFILSCAD
ncbi:MAG: hypothetical protein WBG48_06425 [Pricia sp.]